MPDVLICLTGVLPDPRPVLEETPLMYDFPDAIKRNGEVWELAEFIPEWILTVSGEVQIDDYTPAVDLENLSFATPPQEILGRRSLLHDFFEALPG